MRDFSKPGQRLLERLCLPLPAPRRQAGPALLALLLSLSPAPGGLTNSWVVFEPLTDNAAVGPNVVGNPGMETMGTSQPLAVWNGYGSGYTASGSTFHTGGHSLQCTSGTAGQVHGGYQTIVLNQTTPKALKLTGWSKAQAVTGAADSDYSVYLDIIYTDGTPLWGQTIWFSVGTHDWEYQEAFIVPALPIRQLSCYLLFRNAHTGTVWFDDISIAEVQAPVTRLDGAAVTTGAPAPLPYNPTNRFTLLSGDGLQLQLTQDGGVIEAVADGTNSLQAAGADYASGWFICDRGATSAWWNVGGWVASTNAILRQHGVITNLNLGADILYSVTNNAIRIQATVSNLTSADRAVSLYFALPVAMDGGYWWDSPRDRVALTQAVETATLTDAALGARNLVSQYPLATVAATAALTLAVPPDQYRPFRLGYNRSTHEFFAAFDVGLSSIPSNFPQTATVELWLYRSDPAWGLRSGLAGFYRHFSAAYARNFTNEGIWVAFADLRGITNVSDFGIAYHEIAYQPALVESDDANGIQSFRYVSEPWSYWMTMPADIPNTNYDSVYGYLLTQESQGINAATATLSSGVRDPNGRLEFFPAAQPWCPYGAAFYVNPSPYIADPLYPVTKFNNEWNATVLDVYNHPENGVLDGEYLDSFLSAATVADYSSNHLRATSFPLTYTRDNLRLMTPLVFGTCEMARTIGAEVHARGKALIANTLYVWPYLPLGPGLFDFAGSEINWFDSGGHFVQPPDSNLLYARALAGTRPYGYLLNTDFTKVSSAAMETYMRVCASYGIYPSAFSADASSNNYFEQPALYERDRPLFKKYVPIIRALSLAGWQPVTAATVGNTSVGIEAFGTNPVTGGHYLTARNLGAQTQAATVSFDTRLWAFPGAQWLRLTNLCDGGSLGINLASGSNTVTLTLQPYQCVIYAVQAGPPPRPRLLLNDGASASGSSPFAFDVSALPGQVVVVETAADLTAWMPVQTNTIPDAGIVGFQDPVSFARRFYRARLQ
ncbi:MAG TPA: hypothetical protein VN829_03190 [Dongiaceae bacterium]|nr:hypothetical protein [Dongiaceae bacterium]